LVPTHPAVLALLAVGAALGSGALVRLVPEPALLVAAATLLRVTSAAGSILIWSWLSKSAPDDGGLAEEDDED
jgi:hypothetical protein